MIPASKVIFSAQSLRILRLKVTKKVCKFDLLSFVKYFHVFWSSFYAQTFHTKVFYPAFLCLEFGFDQTFVQKMR